MEWVIAKYAESVIIDNRAFRFLRRGQTPVFDIAALMRMVKTVWQVTDTEDVYFIMPDTGDAEKTIKLFQRWRRKFEEYANLAVVIHEYPKMFDKYLELDADLYCIPCNRFTFEKLKGPCKQTSTIDFDVVLEVIDKLASTGAKIHLLGPCKKLLVYLDKYCRHEFTFDSMRYKWLSRQPRTHRAMITKNDDRMKWLRKWLGKDFKIIETVKTRV